MRKFLLVIGPVSLVRELLTEEGNIPYPNEFVHTFYVRAVLLQSTK